MIELQKVVDAGYQELKLILTGMKKKNYKKIEMDYSILHKIFDEMQRLKYQKNILLDENAKLKNITKNIQCEESRNGSQEFLIIIDVLKELKSKGAWIEYKNITVHTKEFYRIEKEVLENIVEEKSDGSVDLKRILDMMANFGIIRKQDNKILTSATVDGVPKRIYMVRIDSVDSQE
jgi:hypothetical protein